MDFNLDLKLLEHARICNNECKEKMDDGSLHGLTTISSFSCVGCGRNCHMECHRVPKSLCEAVKKVPTNNRVNSYFGEYSYMRLVCENCANWLMVDVKGGETPSFLSLFTKLIDKTIKEKYVLKNVNESMGERVPPVTGLNARANAKRKKPSDNDIEETGLLDEMRKMMASCMEKLDGIDKKIDTSSNDASAKFSALSEMSSKSSRVITGKLSTMDSCVGNINQKLCDIDKKMDLKHGEMENGLQRGFNNLIDKTEKLLSPLTPKRNERRFSFRHQAMVNSARKFSASSRLNGYSGVVKDAATLQGSSTENEIFGTIVPRRLFNGSENGTKGFIHEKAVHLRYVDPLITPTKLLKIMSKNSEIDNAVKDNINCIEINRLTKKGLTEEEIRSMKYGVSYRIGANENIFNIIKTGLLFAPHWEIREWVEKDNNINRSNVNKNVQDNMNRSFLQSSNDFLRPEDSAIIVD